MAKSYISRSLWIGLFLIFGLSVHAQDSLTSEDFGDEHDHAEEEIFMIGERAAAPMVCTKATQAQIDQVNEGNRKYSAFLQGCHAANGPTAWCEQLTRPNPDSRAIFTCTYGLDQPHQLIHPDESTWKYAYQAVRLVLDLEAMGVSVAQIYNWWRPVPYNANVGGSRLRHPFGTSVDVRMSSIPDMLKAHAQLCRWRAQGRLRALGYYGSTGLHFGIGDALANTWGKNCP